MTRIERLISKMPEQTGAAIVTDRFNRFYLTGLPSSAGALLVTREGGVLIIDSRYHELAQSTVRDCEVILQDQLYEQIASILKSQGLSALTPEAASCTLKTRDAYREKLEGVAILEDSWLSDALSELRQCKSQDELSKIRAAGKITDRTFEHLLGFIKPGLTEREVALEAEFYGRSHGAQGVAFPVIVASGENSSRPHATPGERKLRHGDFLIIDMGFVVEGYCSDMTRTVAIGHPSDEQREVYRIVQVAQQAAFEKIKPGIPCKDVDAAARGLIDASQFAGLFGHGLGHSLGIEVHEPPAFNKISEAMLSPGMVLSVEPGIYIPGKFGVRIEDLVAIIGDGFENLTASPKELVVIS
ncbi:MAG: aminopeptidase P family protein [Oscillospiraceae bacterium]|nr:aminopeptidase P family protein [Oscillospiraceae bacterium]